MAAGRSNKSAWTRPSRFLGGFLVVCCAEVMLAVLTLKRAPHAPALSYALFPVEQAFWAGFALPIGPALGVARVALMPKSN